MACGSPARSSRPRASAQLSLPSRPDRVSRRSSPWLPDDTLSYVFDRLQEAGGTAVLVLATKDDEGADQFQIAALRPASDARIEVAKQDGSIADVNERCRVDMFFYCLVGMGGTAVIRRVAAKLIDSGPLELAPST